LGFHFSPFTTRYHPSDLIDMIRSTLKCIKPSLSTCVASKSLLSRSIVHASQRGAEETFVEFNELGLSYPLIMDPKEIKVLKNNMWTQPPENQPENIPFAVERTEIGKALPVYTDYKGGGTKVQTMIRRIRGDVHALKGEMEKGKLLHILVRIIA